MKKKIPKISGRERDVMSILWRGENVLTASSIAEEGGVSINTVQAALRNLVKKEYIEVAQIVYSGTVLSRSYQAIVSAEEYAADQLQAMRMDSLNFSTMSFVDHLAKNDESNKILEELENSIRRKKKQEG